jgi:hypothetical protein
LHSPLTVLFSLLIQLFTKKETTTIPAGGSFQAMFSYMPKLMAESSASLVVQSLGTPLLRWIYPLKGIAEFAGSELKIDISIQARKRLEKQIDLKLDGCFSLMPLCFFIASSAAI